MLKKSVFHFAYFAKAIRWPLHCLLLGLLVCHTSGEVTFRNIGPGAGGTTGAMAMDPSDPRVVFVSVDCGGVHLSEDGGISWENANRGIDYDGAGLEWNNHWGLTVLPEGRALITSRTGKIHAFNRKSKTWEKVFDGPCLASLQQDPHDARTVYALSATGEIFISPKAGEAGSWKQLNTDEKQNLPKGKNVWSFAVDHKDPKLMYAVTDSGVYRSLDGGNSWSSIQDHFGTIVPKRIVTGGDGKGVAYISVGRIPAGENPRGIRSGVYKTVDAGQSWTPACAGLPEQSEYSAMASDPRNPNVLYLGQYDWTGALYRSVNAGQSWEPLLNSDILQKQQPSKNDYGCWHSEPFHVSVGAAIAVGGEDKNRDGLSDVIYFLGDNLGLNFRSVDGGRTWGQISCNRIQAGTRESWAGRGENEFLCARRMIVDPRDPKHLWFVYFDWGVFESVDGGKSFQYSFGPWLEGELLGSMRPLVLDPDNPDVVYCGNAYGPDGPGGVVTNAGNKGWWILGGRNQNRNGLPNGSVLDLVIRNVQQNGNREKHLYATCGNRGVYWLDLLQPGATWQPVNDGLDVGENWHSFYLFGIPGDPDLWVSTSNGLYRSEDGKTWRQLTGTGTPNPDLVDIYCVIADPRNKDILYISIMKRFTESPQEGIFQSCDGGKTWKKIARIAIPYEMALAPDTPQPVLYVASQCKGVWKVFQDADSSWHAEVYGNQDNGLDTTRCWSVTIDPHNSNKLYVGTHGTGVFVGE